MERKTTCPGCGAENLAWRFRCEQCGEELHKDWVIPKLRSNNGTLLLPYLSGLLGTGVLAFVLLLAAGLGAQAYLLGLLAAPLLGLGLGWKWPLAGGVLLIIGSISALILMVTADAWRNVLGLIVLAMTFLPLLASGILFVMAGRYR
ncbi:MAG: hypothetical protein ABIH70_00795 [Chloroflexota bacterium]